MGAGARRCSSPAGSSIRRSKHPSRPWITAWASSRMSTWCWGIFLATAPRPRSSSRSTGWCPGSGWAGSCSPSGRRWPSSRRRGDPREGFLATLGHSGGRGAGADAAGLRLQDESARDSLAAPGQAGGAFLHRSQGARALQARGRADRRACPPATGHSSQGDVVSRGLAGVLATLLLLAGPAAATPVDEKTVHDVAAQLRCVVCQSLSVADSPSETASQMRGIIRERLAAGESPAEVRAYFVEKYGEWILLAPPKSGFNLLVWVVPFVGLGLGLVLVAVVLRRWSRKIPPGAPATVDPALRERIRREMSETESP